jgi:hypothetical protein
MNTKKAKKALTIKEVKNSALYLKYKELSKQDTAFSKAYDELNDLTESSQASACNIVLDFFILREKLMTLHELALLMMKDKATQDKVRNMFVAYHIEFKNKNVKESCERLINRHVITDTPERLGKRSNMLT